MKNRAEVERATDLYIESVRQRTMRPIIDKLDKEVIFSNQDEAHAVIGINAVTAKLNSFARVHLQKENPYGALEATINLKNEPAHPCAKVFDDEDPVSTVVFSTKPNGQILTISVLTAGRTLEETILSGTHNTSAIRSAAQAFADSINTRDVLPLRELLDLEATYESGQNTFTGRDTICKGIESFFSDDHNKGEAVINARTGTIDREDIPACPCAVIYRGDKPLALVDFKVKINCRISTISIKPMAEGNHKIHFSERENLRANGDSCKQLAAIVKKFDMDKLRRLLTRDVKFFEGGHTTYGREETIGEMLHFLKTQKETGMAAKPQLAFIEHFNEPEHPCVQLRAWGKVIALIMIKAKLDRRIEKIEIFTDQAMLKASRSTFSF